MYEDDVRDALSKMKPPDFCSEFVLDRLPFAFENPAEWIEWKSQLAADLDVDPMSVALVGSAALGFSLNPTKYMRPYTKKSDLDVAVVSEWHFDVAWRFLNRVGNERFRWPGEARRSYDDHRNRLVFHRTIATDKLIQYMPFSTQWVEGLGRASVKSPVDGRTVNARLYRDFRSLRDYQVIGIKRARQAMETK